MVEDILSKFSVHLEVVLKLQDRIAFYTVNFKMADVKPFIQNVLVILLLTDNKRKLLFRNVLKKIGKLCSFTC